MRSSSRQSIKSRSFGKPKGSHEGSPEQIQKEEILDARMMITLRRNARSKIDEQKLEDVRRREIDQMKLKWNSDQREPDTTDTDYFWNAKQHRPFY